jgi:2-(1,2-epoxy-1,2-dihydrophenyl)acetyl-CoA isomerase
MTFDTIDYSVTEGVATLTLNRPDRLNSFNATMHGEVREALSRVRDDDTIRCLLLTGNGRGFCAGQDLGERSVAADGTPPDLEASITLNYNPLIRALTSLPKPVVCAVNGVAAGAGANIALACDLVLAARSATFIQAFCRIGLIPDSGGTWSLPHLLGRARALGLALTGEPLDAARAEQWGLIWKCVDDDRLMPEANDLSRRLALGPTLGLALTKQAINAGVANDLDTQLDLEARLQGIAGRSEDYREGVDAFGNKRKPEFKGR